MTASSIVRALIGAIILGAAARTAAYVFVSLRQDARLAPNALSRFVAGGRYRSLRAFFYAMLCLCGFGLSVAASAEPLTWRTWLATGGVLGALLCMAGGFRQARRNDREFRALFRGTAPYCARIDCRTCHPPLSAVGTEEELEGV